MNDQVLRTNLLDFTNALRNDVAGVMLGGGYGLYLKQLHLSKSNVRTLLPVDLWPSPRATEDLDVMLPTEVVADVRSMTAIRAALDRLGYVVIEGSEYLQFVRTIARLGAVKIDLLTAQLDILQSIQSIQADERRARPRASDRPKLHAHPTDGALALNESPLMIEIDGTLSDGQPATARVAIPHPFPYLLMKLTAYRDRRNDPTSDLGRHHALDVFRIVAMLTEADFDAVRGGIARFADNAQVQSCTGVVASHFARATAPGLLAMREHPLWQNDPQIDLFVEVLNDLFS